MTAARARERFKCRGAPRRNVSPSNEFPRKGPLFPFLPFSFPARRGPSCLPRAHRKRLKSKRRALLAAKGRREGERERERERASGRRRGGIRCSFNFSTYGLFKTIARSRFPRLTSTLRGIRAQRGCMQRVGGCFATSLTLPLPLNCTALGVTSRCCSCRACSPPIITPLRVSLTYFVRLSSSSASPAFPVSTIK
jgi:hypothetical protein